MIELPICNLGNQLDPTWDTCVRLLGPDDELPIPQYIENINLDLETTSGKPNVASTNPHGELCDDSFDDNYADNYSTCKICGIGILFDDERIPYYIPIRHSYLDDDGESYLWRQHDCPNINVDKVYDWLRTILARAKTWSNHNIKYDVHVLWNELGYVKLPRLVDTLNLSKLSSNYEEQLNYGLTVIMRLFGIDITPYETKLEHALGKNKDYGLCPPDIMAVYNAVDTLCIQYLLRNLSIGPECGRIVDMEENLLPELIKMERVGLRLDVDLLAKDWKRLYTRNKKRINAIKKEFDFPDFEPGVKKSVKELFIERLGWVLPFTDSSLKKLAKKEITEEQATFSFSKLAIIKHIRNKPHVAKMWSKYQDDQKLLTSYTIPYLERHCSGEGLIHTNVNQILHTGRMSQTAPSMQVLPHEAKYYIVPYNEDYVLVEFDLSQIEFRVIVHYIQNKKAIEQFRRDPTTDFHVWVAEMCGIKRRPAKTCNFLCGYGGGKDRLVLELSGLPDIRYGLDSEDLIRDKAYSVYKQYHATLPELKPTTYRCSEVLRARGYVRTLLGRRRHIPKMFHYKAFNSIGQGSAADIQKDITLRLRKFFSIECMLQCLVHDSWLFSIKRNRVDQLVPEIKYEIERPIEGVEFSVPLLSSYSISDKSWGDCK